MDQYAFKMNQVFERFPSKLLLFGEYSLMYGSKALSIPFPGKGGILKMSGRGEHLAARHKESNNNLWGFYSHLCNISSELPEGFLLDEMKSALSQGLYFDSDIPEGYGLGSSGALVAAIYHAFKGNQVSEAADLSRQKKIFAKMESYFHGQSSGIDPLSSWSGKPLLFSNEDKVDYLPDEIPVESINSLYLLDTGIPRKTAGLVKHFAGKMKEDQYREVLMEQYIPLSDSCIAAFTGKPAEFFPNAEKLSFLQFRYFKPMIPEKIQKLWKKGLTGHEFKLKLCGAGGGGYMLCFTLDYEKSLSNFAEAGFKLIPLA